MDNIKLNIRKEKNAIEFKKYVYNVIKLETKITPEWINTVDKTELFDTLNEKFISTKKILNKFKSVLYTYFISCFISPDDIQYALSEITSKMVKREIKIGGEYHDDALDIRYTDDCFLVLFIINYVLDIIYLAERMIKNCDDDNELKTLKQFITNNNYLLDDSLYMINDILETHFIKPPLEHLKNSIYKLYVSKIQNNENGNDNSDENDNNDENDNGNVNLNFLESESLRLSTWFCVNMLNEKFAKYLRVEYNKRLSNIYKNC